MKAKKTDKRAIFTHKIYCSKPHKRKKNEMKLQQHTKYHTQFKIQQSIKSVREQLVIEIYIKSCSMQNKQLNREKKKNVRIKGKLIINTYSKRGKVTSCCWTAMYNDVVRRAHVLTAQETRDCYLALAYIHIRTQF